MSLSRVFVLLSEIGGSRSAQADSNEPIPLTNVDSIAERYVHSVLLTGLKAGTTYALTITDANKSVLYSSKYRTVPDRNGSVLRLAMGGDVGMTAEGEKLTSSLVAYDPDAIILGGDTVYDDGMRTCYFSWDTFY